MACGHDETIGNHLRRPIEPVRAPIDLTFALRHCTAQFRTWMGRARQRHALGDLDARLLGDIGVTWEAAQRECATPFWRSAAASVAMRSRVHAALAGWAPRAADPPKRRFNLAVWRAKLRPLWRLFSDNTR